MSASGRRSGASALRRRADRALAAVSPAAGPARLRGYAARARLRHAHRLRDSDPARTVQLLRPLLGGPYSAQAASRLLTPLIAIGAEPEALAVATTHWPAETPLPARQALHLYGTVGPDGSPDDVEAARGLLAKADPQTQTQVNTISKVLRRQHDLERAREFVARVKASGADLSVNSLESWVHLQELNLLLEADDVDVPAAIAKYGSAVEDPWVMVVRVLSRRGAWDELADAVEAASADGEDLPSWQLRKAARGAAVQGWLSAAIRLAQAAIVGRPDYADDLAAMVESGRDELALLEHGWPADPAAGSSADRERSPRSVLSLLGQSLPLRSGGYATRSHGLLTGLAGRGWEMTAATRLGFPYDLWWDKDDPRPVDPIDVVDGVPYHRLLQPGVTEYPRVPLVDYVRSGVDLATDLGQRAKVSLVHAASLSDVGLLGMETASRLGVPFIYELRGLKQLLEDARLPRFHGSERDRYFDAMEQTAVRRADHVLVITKALGELVADMGVSPERITVVPNGVHLARFTPREPDEELRAELGLRAGTIIGYVGSIAKYEGLDLLLDAAALLRRQGADFEVIIVGDGAREAHIRQHCTDLGLDDVVTFTGRVPHDQVERYLSLIDITPFPRLPLPVCELISPIKPFEAMAMRKSVVVSDVAALTEIVDDGVTGRSFAKGDAADLARVLTELIEDAGARARMGAAARAWVEQRHDWSVITERVDAAYRTVLGTDA